MHAVAARGASEIRSLARLQSQSTAASQGDGGSEMAGLNMLPHRGSPSHFPPGRTTRTDQRPFVGERGAFPRSAFQPPASDTPASTGCHIAQRASLLRNSDGLSFATVPSLASFGLASSSTRAITQADRCSIFALAGPPSTRHDARLDCVFQRQASGAPSTTPSSLDWVH